MVLETQYSISLTPCSQHFETLPHAEIFRCEGKSVSFVTQSQHIFISHQEYKGFSRCHPLVQDLA